VRAWLGSDYATAGIIAAALALGNLVNLGTGVMSTVSRVLGRPGIETKYGLLSAAINIVLTVPLAWTFGIYGVLAATVAAQIVGSLWFVRIFRRQIDPAFRFVAPGLPIVPALLAAAGAAAATTAVALRLPHGLLALTGCAALGAVALFLYVAWVVRGGRLLSAPDHLSTLDEARSAAIVAPRDAYMRNVASPSSRP
jgi:O-antigen/teichoic acid export membrane protein